MGQSCGFYGLDTSNSIGYIARGTTAVAGTASAIEIGECNYIIIPSTFNPFGTNLGNTERLNRML